MKAILNQILANKFLLSMVAFAMFIVIATLITMISPNRVKVKRRIIQKDSKLEKIAVHAINRSKFLVKIRDTMRIQLGLITSKSEQRNEYYATIIVFCLIIFVVMEGIIIALFSIPFIFKPLLFLAAIIVPYFITDIYLRMKRKKIYNDFPELVSIFITKYANMQNIKEALRKSIPDLPKSLRHEVKRLINSMNTSDNYFLALDDFSERVDYIMCTAFVALLKTGYKTNVNIIQSLIELENYISQERLESQRKVEQLKDKEINLYLIIIGIVVSYFFVVNRLQDKAINFYWHTFQGQAVMGAAIIFSIITVVSIMIEKNL